MALATLKTDAIAYRFPTLICRPHVQKTTLKLSFCGLPRGVTGTAIAHAELSRGLLASSSHPYSLELS